MTASESSPWAAPPAPRGTPGQSAGPGQTAAPARQRFGHDGRVAELFALTLVNLALKVLTLGLFHFWGKTRVRRYVWSQTHFAGEQFEYTGTGPELLRGFLLGLVLLAPLAAVWGYPQVASPEGMARYGIWLILLSPLAYVYLLFLIGTARYSARRYLLSHTRWRGIRFALTGSAAGHGWKMLGYSLLLGITFTFYTPFMRSRLTGNILNHMWFGDQRFHYDGQGRDLLGRYWGFIGLMALFAGVGALFLFPFLTGLIQGLQRLLAPGGLLSQALGLLLLLLGYLPWAIAWLWYRSGELRYFFAHTSYGPLRFRAEFPTWGFVWLRATNLAAVTFTLGLAYAWAVVRTGRFLSRHVLLEGELEPGAIGQSPREVLASGEGLAEALGLSAI